MSNPVYDLPVCVLSLVPHALFFGPGGRLVAKLKHLLIVGRERGCLDLRPQCKGTVLATTAVASQGKGSVHEGSGNTSQRHCLWSRRQWCHKVKAVSWPRRQWRHEAKAVSWPRRQCEHKAKAGPHHRPQVSNRAHRKSLPQVRQSSGVPCITRNSKIQHTSSYDVPGCKAPCEGGRLACGFGAGSTTVTERLRVERDISERAASRRNG